MTITDKMWEMLSRYWPKEHSGTIQDPMYIVAGNQREFDNFVIEKRARGFNFDYRYVYSVDVLRGLDRIRGFYIGTYADREDWYAIETQIKIIKSR